MAQKIVKAVKTTKVEHFTTLVGIHLRSKVPLLFFDKLQESIEIFVKKKTFVTYAKGL